MLVMYNAGSYDLWIVNPVAGESPSLAWAWTKLSVNGGPPSGWSGPNMAVYDPSNNRATVLFGTPSNTLDAWVLSDANGIVNVAIDIKPDTYPNSINLGSNGTVPVAILGSATFDTTEVDPTTVSLASAQVKLKGNGTPMASITDVNSDGFPDLVVHVSTEALTLTDQSVEATLTGQTYDGHSFQGKDNVKIVP